MKIRSPKYKYDIGLDHGAGAHLVAWASGLMVFFVTMALAVNLGLNTVTNNWVSGLSGSLTAEIKQPASEAGRAGFDAQVAKLVDYAAKHAGVASARALTRKEISALIQPFLGGAAPESMPLPAIIDIKLAEGADAAAIAADIQKTMPGATVDSHDDTLADVKTLVATARLFVLLLTGVIVMLTAASISGLVRAKLAIHAQEVETLHLVGASDEYIARQFRHHTLKGALKGALLGVTCMVAAILGVSWMTHTVDTTIFPQVRLMPLHWAAIAAAPVVIGTLIAHLTAQRTVMRELARLP